MDSKYTIKTVEGRDYVSVDDAKRIMGASSAKELRSLGSATIQIGNSKPLWSLGWLISKSKQRLSKEFDPDVKWMQWYEKNRDATDTRPRKNLVLPHLPSDGELNTSKRLRELVEIMPPPKRVPDSNLDWQAIERTIGVKYPTPFKDFIKIYGSLQWFDWLQPLVPFGKKTPQQFRDFLGAVFEDSFGKDTLDGEGNLLFTPRFGTTGGWLPFMIGTDGETYAWVTDGLSKRWRVIYVNNRRVRVLPPISIVEMIVGWLKDEPPMQELWGSIKEFRKHSPQRISMLC